MLPQRILRCETGGALYADKWLLFVVQNPVALRDLVDEWALQARLAEAYNAIIAPHVRELQVDGGTSLLGRDDVPALDATGMSVGDCCPRCSKPGISSIAHRILDCQAPAMFTFPYDGSVALTA